MTELATGVYEDLDAALYHRDFFPDDAAPSLSASLAHILVSRTPRHAWQAHPRLNPKWQSEDDSKFDFGKAVHQVLLEGNANVVVVEADDWRTKAAKETREEAWRAKMTPILWADWERVQEMCAAVRSQLACTSATPTPLQDGRPEVTLLWHEPNGVTCRSRVDWLHEGNVAIDDVKTTRVHPERWMRGPLYDHGYDLQAAMYLRGVKALTGVEPEWRWIVCEVEPPYECIVVSPLPEVLAIGEAKVEHALKLWSECLATDDWPGYSPRVHWAELPAWEEARWFEREAREEAA